MKPLNFEQYVTFLLLFAAYADDLFKPEEAIQILDTVDKSTLIEVKKYFLELTMDEQIAIIRQYKHLHFETPQKREFLYKEIRKVLYSDLNLMRREDFMLGLLKQILED